jgi:hypothetical protein
VISNDAAKTMLKWGAIKVNGRSTPLFVINARNFVSKQILGSSYQKQACSYHFWFGYRLILIFGGMNRYLSIVLHVVFWVLTGTLIAGSFSIEAQEIEIINDVETVQVVRNSLLFWQLIGVLAISFLLFYGTLWNIRRLHRDIPGKRIVILGLLLLAGAIALTYSLTYWVWMPYGPVLPPAVSNGIVLFYFASALAYGLAGLWYRNQQRQQQLALEKKEAELSLLRNQLQPHFLFNALNNLLYMVDQKQNPKLADGFERLSQLLRYVVEEPPKGKVSVRQELAFLRNYAAMQLLRFEDGEVDFDLTVKGSYDQQMVEPGLFLPFVENAFKYGTEPERYAKIEVNFDLTKADEVRFKISNPILITALAESTGSGIAATRRRLQLIYPQKHVLTISEDDPFIVELSLHTL